METKKIMRILYTVRIAQLVFSLSVLGYSIALALYDSININSAWGSANCSVIVALYLTFLIQRPQDLWPLSFILDCLGLLCSIAAVIGLGLSESLYWYDFYYEPNPALVTFLTIACVVVVLFMGTGIYDLRMRTVRNRPNKDPLQPYLIKREIDVWCYPVQNENGQPDVRYEPATDENPGRLLSPDESHPSEALTVPKAKDPQHSVTGQSVAETVAGWSVPSGNATLRYSQITRNTALPSYRGPSMTMKSEDTQSV